MSGFSSSSSSSSSGRNNGGDDVSSILGFYPNVFLGEVSNMVDNQLATAVDGFKRDLLTIASQKGFKNIKESMLEEVHIILFELKLIMMMNSNLYLFVERNWHTLHYLNTHFIIAFPPPPHPPPLIVLTFSFPKK